VALAAAFGLSLAVVDVRDGKIRYRRFFAWVSLDLADIVSSGTTWEPFIGYIRLNYSMAQAVLRSRPQPAVRLFRRGDFAILEFLKRHEACLPTRR
jgi:hypothetical protein